MKQRSPAERTAPPARIPLEHEAAVRPPFANTARVRRGDRPFSHGIPGIRRGAARRADTAVARARRRGRRRGCVPRDSRPRARFGARSDNGLHRTAGPRPDGAGDRVAPRVPSGAPSSSRTCSGSPPRPAFSGAGCGFRSGSGNSGRGARGHQRAEGQGEGARPRAWPRRQTGPRRRSPAWQRSRARALARASPGTSPGTGQEGAGSSHQGQGRPPVG